MLKEGSSEIIPERDSIKSLFMKYQFNEIFPLLIKWKNNAKTPFGPDLLDLASARP